MAKQIIYLGYYNVRHEETNRSVSLAAVNKMTYIIDCLERLCMPSTVVSPVNAIGDRGYMKRYKTSTDKGLPIEFLPSFAGRSLLARLIRKIVFSCSLMERLLKISADSTVIAYHSLGYAKILRLAKKIRKFRLILEVEELYQDIKEHESHKSLEDNIVKEADAFIISSQSIYKRLVGPERIAIVSSGSYKTNQKIEKPLNDSIVHVVYAGTFETQKGGVLQAINAARFLKQNYHVHILGFGSASEVENVLRLIDEVNKTSLCKVSFEGQLTGEPFVRFIQRCHIGLSTQNPIGEYNNTSFPSKILTYLANGLKVVSVDIPVVRESAFRNIITLYQGSNSEKIAEAIALAAHKDNSCACDTLNKLDALFIENLRKII